MDLVLSHRNTLGVVQQRSVPGIGLPSGFSVFRLIRRAAKKSPDSLGLPGFSILWRTMVCQSRLWSTIVSWPGQMVCTSRVTSCVLEFRSVCRPPTLETAASVALRPRTPRTLHACRSLEQDVKRVSSALVSVSLGNRKKKSTASSRVSAVTATQQVGTATFEAGLTCIRLPQHHE